MRIFIPRFVEQEVETERLVTRLSCAVQPRILKADGRLVIPFGKDVWYKNLITNGGLDQGCQGSSIKWMMYNSYCHVGTGTTTPANTDIKLTTWVKSVTNTFAATCSGVNDTTNGAFTGNQNYQFTTESSTVTYTEIGLGTSSSTSGIFTHATFPGVTLNNGDTFIPAYSFTESIPSIITPITVSLSAVNGFNVSGNMKVVGTFANLFGTVASSGVWSNGTTGFPLHLTSGALYSPPALCTGPTTFPAVNAALSETGAVTGTTPSPAGYTAGTFTRNINAVFAPGVALAGVNCIRLLADSTVGAGHGLYLILSSAQTKASATNLTITTALTMARG